MNIIHQVLNENNIFSLIDWQQYGLISEAEQVILIPESMIEYLNNPCPFMPGLLVKETHFLFYLPSGLDEIALTVNSMRRLLNNQSLLRFRSPIGGWFSRHDFATLSVFASWKLLFAGILPNSKGITYKKQKRLFQQGKYAIPFMRTVVAMIILKAKKTSQILSNDEWGRTAESYDDGLRVRVGVFDDGAICLSSRWSGKGYPDTGIFAEKIF